MLLKNSSSLVFRSERHQKWRLFSFYFVLSMHYKADFLSSRKDGRKLKKTRIFQLFYSFVAYFTPMLLLDSTLFAYICEKGVTAWKKKPIAKSASV